MVRFEILHLKEQTTRYRVMVNKYYLLWEGRRGNHAMGRAETTENFKKLIKFVFFVALTSAKVLETSIKLQKHTRKKTSRKKTEREKFFFI